MPNMGVRSIAVMIGTLLLSPACDLYCAHKPIYDAVRHEDPRALDRRIRRGDSPDYLLYLAGDMSRPGAVAYLLRKYPPGTQPSHRKDYKYGQKDGVQRPRRQHHLLRADRPLELHIRDRLRVIRGAIAVLSSTRPATRETHPRPANGLRRRPAVCYERACAGGSSSCAPARRNAPPPPRRRSRPRRSRRCHHRRPRGCR